MKRPPFTALFLPVFASLIFIANSGAISPAAPETADPLALYNVVWDTPGGSSADSMPLGNGDIGLNAWIESNGDLLFYISRGNAWSEDLKSPKHGAYGLIKVGRVRVSLSPSPFTPGASFHQKLNLRRGCIEIAGMGGAEIELWVDANRPVIHLQARTAGPVSAKISLESWRTTPTQWLGTDTILTDQKNRIAWYYHNSNKEIPQLVHRTIGAVVSGEGLVSTSPASLQSKNPASNLNLAVYPLTAQCPTPQVWLDQVDKQIATVNSIPIDQARKEHDAWWNQFWNRSWIFLSGDKKAWDITEGYLLQRFMNACAGRGEFPIKFNGSIFNVDDPKPEVLKDKVWGQVTMPVTADFRAWGYMYWFQNTRPIYWPMLASGDYDLMQPLFRMFLTMLPGNAKQVREFYGHDGAYFQETAPFWGGISKITPEEPGNYTKHYFTPILELSTMMLDYYEYTGDVAFARETLLPIADAGITFFDQHFKRDANGKLLLDPDNAIEMYWKVRNPLPDIAGLHYVLQRLLELPPSLTDPAACQRWQRLLAELPPVPTEDVDGRKKLIPYEQGQLAGSHNSENPELYAIYPFRIYGLGKPVLDIGRLSFDMRKIKRAGCWSQDAVQAALLGDAGTAQQNVAIHLTRKDRRYRFPAFWMAGFDYAPDEDNGGNGMHALQLMLMQCEGKKIRLLPAWPVYWNADFKLCAPMNTTVQASVRNGKIVELQVTPPERKTDVEIMRHQSNAKNISSNLPL